MMFADKTKRSDRILDYAWKKDWIIENFRIPYVNNKEHHFMYELATNKQISRLPQALKYGSNILSWGQ
jgi:hypothetical protein